MSGLGKVVHDYAWENGGVVPVWSVDGSVSSAELSSSFLPGECHSVRVRQKETEMKWWGKFMHLPESNSGNFVDIATPLRSATT
jgi:hypothetical protein